MNADEKKGARIAADVVSHYNGTSSHPYRLDDCVLAKLNLSRRKPRVNKRAHDEWMRGYAAALAAVVRLYGETSLAKNVMVSDGLSLDKFKRAGVEKFDMDQLRRAMGGR